MFTETLCYQCVHSANEHRAACPLLAQPFAGYVQEMSTGPEYRPRCSDCATHDRRFASLPTPDGQTPEEERRSMAAQQHAGPVPWLDADVTDSFREEMAADRDAAEAFGEYVHIMDEERGI